MTSAQLQPVSPLGVKRSNYLLPVAALTLACIAALLLLASGPGSRMELWSFRSGFTIMKYGAGTGLVAAAAGGVALIASLKERKWKTIIISNLALAIGVTTFAIPFYWKNTAENLPKIHDISTDTTNPPRFVAILPLRKNAPNPAEYGGGDVAEKQARAYPDINPLHLKLPATQAFGLALETAQRMGWNIVAAVPTEGRIEASDTTFWYGFKDDIVIRITSSGSGSQLDIRSVSRVGLSDVGTNARRIRIFMKKLTELLPLAELGK